jgi:hypothetical protein
MFVVKKYICIYFILDGQLLNIYQYTTLWGVQ